MNHNTEKPQNQESTKPRTPGNPETTKPHNLNTYVKLNMQVTKTRNTTTKETGGNTKTINIIEPIKRKLNRIVLRCEC